jgi:hypothetical protein
MDINSSRTLSWLPFKAAETPFTRDVAGWAIVSLNLLSAAWSTFVFLGFLRLSPVEWVMINTCAPSVYLFALAFLLKSPLLMVAASVWMLRFGVGGLFVFSWEGVNLTAQVGHLLMTAGVLYTAWRVIGERRWRALALGAALGLAALIPFTLIQGAWFKARPGLLESLFSGEYGPPGQ